MKTRICGLCAYAVAISAILILLITSIDVTCFDRGFYESEYASMNTASSLHMSQEDLMKATNTLLDYLQDERNDIQVEITTYGISAPAFNERETLHMVDVKNLYQLALYLRMGACLLLLLSTLFLVYKKRGEALDMLTKGYTQISIAFICFVCMLGLWAAVDFTSLWESFHRLFFTNDLWLLNPRTDLMINMFPEAFFFHMVLKLTLMFLVPFLLLLVFSLWYRRTSYPFYRMRIRKG